MCFGLLLGALHVLMFLVFTFSLCTNSIKDSSEIINIPDPQVYILNPKYRVSQKNFSLPQSQGQSQFPIAVPCSCRYSISLKRK